MDIAEASSSDQINVPQLNEAKQLNDAQKINPYLQGLSFIVSLGFASR